MSTIATFVERSPSRGVFVRRPLVHWEELLEEWCLVHERYCRLVQDDAIYWNGERPNIAALAAGAWRCGWAALEEFAQPKIAKRSRFAGRADLYLMSHGSEDYVEAKSNWLYVSKTKCNPDRFLKAFRVAIEDARKIELKPGKHKRVGVAFGSIYTPQTGLAPVSRGLASVFGKLTTEDFDAAAWSFPMVTRALTLKDGSINFHFPGVVLLAKTVI
jgi:hypothetical protein